MEHLIFFEINLTCISCAICKLEIKGLLLKEYNVLEKVVDNLSKWKKKILYKIVESCFRKKCKWKGFFCGVHKYTFWK